VISEPLWRAASTTSVPRDRPLISLLRRGKLPRRAACRVELRQHRPALRRDAIGQAGVFRRVHLVEPEPSTAMVRPPPTRARRALRVDAMASPLVIVRPARARKRQSRARCVPRRRRAAAADDGELHGREYSGIART